MSALYRCSLIELLTYAAGLSNLRPHKAIVASWSRFVAARHEFQSGSARLDSNRRVSREHFCDVLSTRRPANTAIGLTRFGDGLQVVAQASSALPICILHTGMNKATLQRFRQSGTRLVEVEHDIRLPEFVKTCRAVSLDGYFVALLLDSYVKATRSSPFLGFQVELSPIVAAVSARLRLDFATLSVSLDQLDYLPTVEFFPGDAGRGGVLARVGLERSIAHRPEYYDWQHAEFLFTDVTARFFAASFVNEAADFLSHQLDGRLEPQPEVKY